MAPNKISFHCGPGGNPTGIGDFMRALDAARIPFFLKSVDHYGPIFEAQNIMKASGVPHVLVFRLSNRHDTGEMFDTPNYNATPEAAAAAHWQMTKAKLPPEMDRERVWLEVINEVDRNRCNWLGWFGVAIANLAHADGYKVSLFSWAGGEPEPEGWEEPGMLAYLQLCANKPQQTAVALHEYSFAGDFLKSRMAAPGKFEPAELFSDGRLIGRFRELFGVCDRHGIARPTVHITEFGWALNHLPTPETAVTQLGEASQMYAQYPEVQGAAIWYLGAWDNDMPNKTQRLIKPVTDYTLSTEHDTILPAPGLHYLPGGGFELTYPNNAPTDPPNGGDMDCNPRVPYAREYYVLPQDATMARYLEVAQQAYAGRKTLAFSYDDAGHAPGVSSNTAVLYDIPADKQQEFLDWYAEHYPATTVIFAGGDQKPPDPDPEPGNPLDGLKLGHLFTVPYALTSGFNAPRDYGPHEGADYDVIGANPNSKELVLCTYDGTVERSLDSTGGYGKYVRIVHTRNGRQFYTRYCHLDTRLVQVGQVIKAGQPVGEIGATGNAYGEHVHFNLEVPGFGLSGYVVADVVDPVPYLPKPITQPPPPATGPARIGLHSSADPGDLFGGEAEFHEFATLFPGVIKVLSATSETAVRRLATENPGAEWIVRAFLQWGGRNVTPQNFYDWTKDDVLRTVNALRSLGIKDSSIHIELHNEPNLALEGWGSTWADGTGFNTWLLDVLKKYLLLLPNVDFLYPGLSPGGAIPGARYDSGAFLDQSIAAATACDGVGVHAYWSDPFPIAQAYAHIDWYVSRFGTKPLWITEASRNDRPATKPPSVYAAEYCAFWQELRKRPSVQGVTYFVASASDGYFAPECWVVNKQSRGIAAAIKALKE